MAAKKILVIDDDGDYTKMLGLQLESKGYEVVVSNDGEEGFQKVLTEKPHLILLDIKMPEMDGFTFVRRLKTNEAIKKIPVMILTGYEGMRDLFRFEGIAGYFVKGGDRDALLKSLADILLAAESA
ncbi:MAG: response regulator [Candidatus Omnitrophota bacterium]